MSVIHYWPLDEESGLVAEDTITNASGAVQGDPSEATAVSSKFGFGRNLQLATDAEARVHLWTAAENLVASHAQWSVLFWVRKDSTDWVDGSSYQPLIAFGDESISGRSAFRLVTSRTGGEIRLHLMDSSGTLVPNQWGTDTYPPNWFDQAWHWAAIICDDVDVRIYWDNVLQDTVASAVSLMPQVAQSYLGGNQPAYAPTGQTAADFTPFHFDDVAVLDHALTTEERDALWNSGTGESVAVYYDLSAPEDPFDDWAALIDPITSQIYYACEIDDGILDPIRPPISSWQATVQSGRASYAQAVIPAATAWVSAITDRSDGEFVIYRGVRYSDGSTQESELARAPLGDVRFDVGPTNATMMISGYAILPPQGALTRTLTNVRSESTGSGFRVRADIDWFLRPGHTAISRGTSFTVSYINYYVTGGDSYMDVGEQTL